MAQIKSHSQQIGNVSIERLRAELMGQVITPDDAEYHAIHMRLSREVVRRPALIVRPVDAIDISRVVSLARETGMELAIRSGGHSLAGYSTTEGGIVLDLALMKGMEVNVQERTAWAEAGLNAGEYTAEAAKYGLATGFGDSASVGLGGLTTGGGIGYLVRKYGLTIDNLLAARVVTADGQIRHVDAENHPDLFWGIRGGGGNFGVVTHFKFQLHPVDMIVGGPLILPATPKVIADFAALADAAPDELSAIVLVMPAPPLPFIPPQHYGQMVMLATLAYTGDIEEGMRAVAPFRQLAEPVADLVGPMPYPQIYMPDDPNAVGSVALRSKFIDKLDEHTAQIMLEQLDKSDAPFRVAQFRVLGGAMARVPADATAFAHRSSRILTAFMVLYENRDEYAIHNAWAQTASDAVDQGNGEVYVNFLAAEGAARVHDAYPSLTRERLASLKAQYDPTNVFRLNQNIAPKAK